MPSRFTSIGRRRPSIQSAVISTLESLETRRMLAFQPLNVTATTTSTAGDAVEKDMIASTPAATFVNPGTFLYKSGNFLTKKQAGQPLDIAFSYARDNAGALGLQPTDVTSSRVSDFYTDADTGISHIYLKQTFNGLDIANADMTITVMRDGRVLSAGSTFVANLGVARGVASPSLTSIDALKKAASNLNLKLKYAPSITRSAVGLGQVTTLKAADISIADIPAQLHYVATPDGGVQLAWDFIIQPSDGAHWYDTSVSAADGALLFTADWVDNYVDPNVKLPIGDGNAAIATTALAGSVQQHVTQSASYNAGYNVYAIPNRSPSTGTRTVQTNPWDLAASPYGWQDTNGTPGGDSNVSAGNNVSAQEDRDANNTGGIQASGGGLNPDGSGSLTFDSPLDLTTSPTVTANQQSAIINLYYWNNVIHDLHYKYGFTEVAGNFQQANYTGQGAGNDRVQADAQDGTSTDNANFATPADGTSGRMQMYIFDGTASAPITPNRDGDFDAQVMIHEYGHGVSNRLTGGPSNVNALNSLQSGGMGEGWGDWWGLMFLQTDGSVAAQNAANPEGTYVLNQPLNGAGIRRQPYSYDMTVNTQTLNDFAGSVNDVHAIGELWVDVLWDMNWNLIRKYGFNSNIAQGYDGSSTPAGQGNLLALRLVEDALKIQPANPTLFQARDAIIAADQALNGGADLKEIWRAFARRGWGVNASTASASASSVVVSFDVPPALFDPFVSASTPNAPSSTNVSSVAFSFDEPMNPASFSAAADIASFTGPAGIDLLGQITTSVWSNSNKTLTINFNAQSTDGPYAMTIGPNILAADDAHPMDQNQAGVLGAANDSYTATFSVDHFPGPDGGGYEASPTPVQNIDLVIGATGVTTLVNASDDAAGTIALPAGNSFTFYGTNYTSIFPNANGLITFGSSTTAFTNGDMTSTPTQAAIGVLWDDWRTDVNTTGATDSAVLWKLNGNDLIIEWSDVPNRTGTDGTATFQAILKLNTTAGRNGDIYLNYPDITTNSATYSQGASSTVGVKDVGAQGTSLTNKRLVVAQNTNASPFVATGKAIRLTSTRASGVVFNDDNGNGALDAGETPVANSLIYADVNNNGVRDAGEITAISDINGAYTMTSLAEGANVIRIDQTTFIDTQLSPSTTLSMGEAGTGRDVGVFNTLISGTSGADTFTFGTNPANDRDVIVFTPSVGSARNFSILKSVMKKLTFAGGAGADHLTVDFGNGDPMANFPAVAPTLAFSGSGADTLTITGSGTFRFLADPAINTPTLSVESLNGATVRFEAPTSHIAGVALNGGKAAVAAGGSRLLVVNGSIAMSNAGDLEMNDNDLLVKGSSLSAIEAFVSQGYGFGAFPSLGISSAAARDNANSNTTLGVLFGQQFNDNNGGTFDGQVVSASDVLVKYTYFGDVDFNGAVDSTDYNLIDFGFLTGTSGWANGDVDGSGHVDSTDYNLIDFAFVSQTGML